MNIRIICSSTVLFLCAGLICFSCSTPGGGSGGRMSDSSTGAEPAVSEDYRLAPEDIIGVIVWKEQDFSREAIVRPDGKVSLPVIGDVAAAGLTTEELKEKIRVLLADYIDEPTVSVSVLAMNSMKFFVQGEVAKPGAYDLKSNYTVLQAISLAGGFSEWAEKDKIAVIRKEGDQEIRIPVDYDAITTGSDAGQNLVLKRGDTILVP